MLAVLTGWCASRPVSYTGEGGVQALGQTGSSAEDLAPECEHTLGASVGVGVLQIPLELQQAGELDLQSVALRCGVLKVFLAVPADLGVAWPERRVGCEAGDFRPGRAEDGDWPRLNHGDVAQEGAGIFDQRGDPGGVRGGPY